MLHTEAGGESGTIAEFTSSSAQLSAHYAVSLAGDLDVFVDVANRAWANGILEPGAMWPGIATACGVDPALNPNHVTVSCETEDLGRGDQVVTHQQYDAVRQALWEATRRYPSSIRYLARHADISPQSRAHCPGDRWVASGQFAALAAEFGLRTAL